MPYTLIAIVVFLLELFWFMQLIHLMSRDDSYFPGKYDKLCWVAVLLFTNWIGALAYLMLKPLADSATERFKSENFKPRKFIKMPNAPRKCPNCGESYFYNAQSCLSCGWSYDEPSDDDSGNESFS